MNIVKTFFVKIISLLLLFMALSGCANAAELRVNSSMQEELENRAPDRVIIGGEEKSPCNTHQTVKWEITTTTHKTKCVKCGEIVFSEEPHEEEKREYQGYMIINGEAYVCCEVKCRCGWIIERIYEPYTTHETEGGE